MKKYTLVSASMLMGMLSLYPLPARDAISFMVILSHFSKSAQGSPTSLTTFLS